MSAETRALLLQLLADDKAIQFLPNEAGDFTIPAGTGQPAAIAAGVRDIDGDGLADLIIGAPGDDDKEADAGRVFIQPGSVAGGSSLRLGRAADIMTIEGAHTGDHVGSSVAAIRDLDGGGEDDILVGAPGTDIGSAVDAGAAYVIWSVAGSSVDLGDPFKGEGGGFAIKGEATGDAAGSSVLTIGDLNGDGKDDILVAAPGQDAGGSNAGAVYLVWGKAGDTVVNLANVASGSGGFRIVGSSAGDRAGSAIGTVADLNGDGKAEILIGAPGSILGGTGSGAVYVAWGKSGTGGIDLSAVEAGTGGFVIEGVGGDNVGSAIAGLGDVNGDGLSDILVGATGSDGGYVVFGKAGGSVVDLADVRNGNGGFRILAESPGGLAGLSVAGGQDFNHDGIVDIVVGAPHDGEGGADAGAIYVVWGGIESTIDLALVAQGIGGVKITGYAGGLAGTSVTIAPDLDGDGTADLLVSAPGGSGSVWAVYSDPAWQPAAAALYVHGTDGNDMIGPGYGKSHIVGDGSDVILGHAGNDSISAGGGDDTIDGGVGADTMTGGTGNDTYHVDNPGDVVIEAAGGGIDTVIVRGNWQIADNVENVVLEGAGSTLTGNAGANRIEGDAADDVIDGGAGDDLEIGGDGDDVLVSASGHDSLVGGAGDDIYRIHGGSAHIEDFQGHNTIDASEATGNSRIDLSGASETEIELEATDLGIGGTVTGALDIQFLQDLTGSFSDDIDNVRQLVPQIVTALQTVQSGARFGVSTFRDKPMDPFGGIADSLGDPDWVYATDQYLGTSASALSTAYAGFLADGGNDEPEAQLEALLQLGLRANSEVGFKANAARFVVLFTDATFHTADDGLAAGLTTPNNGDTVLDGNGIGENYPLISQVRAVLEAANIIPIFAVTSDVEATYQPLVTALGRGTVVTLSADSANIVGAITSGLQSATTTQIADAIGGNGNDTLIGNGGNNTLTGNGGDDLFEGRAGNDRIVGNAGLDTAIYAGILAEYAVTWNLDGSLVLADTLAGRDGNDTLAGVEQARFGTSRYAIDYAAHTITAMSVPAAPATGVYLESNGHVSLSSTALQVFGTPGQEAVTLLAGAAGVTVDQNIDTIFLPGTVAGYFFQQTGNRLNVFSGSELLLRMTVQSDADGTLLSFADGMASAAIQGGVMQLGGAPVSSTAATALAPALAPPGAAPTAGPSAQVFLASDAHFAAAVSGMRIFGGAGSSEMLAIQPGASGLLADQAVDIVSFADTASSYAFQQSGNRLAVFDAAGATQMISIPVQTDADGTQLIFAGQSYHAAFSSGVLHIGTLTIGTTPAPLAFPAVADTPGTFG